MAERFRRWFPFLSGASPAPGGEETAARAEEMLREAARARTPAEKERIRSRFWKSVRSGRESPDINPVFIRNLFLKEEIYPLRKDEMIFEGGRYTALRNTEAYLAAMYGNYMDLPDSLETRHSPEVEQYLARDLAALGL